MRTEKKMKSAFFVAAVLAAGWVWSEVPVSINYAGQIEGIGANGASQALSEASFYMAFRLYDQPGGGRVSEKKTALWGRQASVALVKAEDGSSTFDVDLADSFGTPVEGAAYVSLADALEAAVRRGSSDLYIGLTPKNDQNAEVFPRQKVTAVLKAIQAGNVLEVADGFTATGGVVTVEGPLEVMGLTTLEGPVQYEGSVAFDPQAQVSFNGGLAVAGTLKAGSVATSDLSADVVEVSEFKTRQAGSLSVVDTLSVGAATWSGALAGATAAVGRVSSALSAKAVRAQTLVVSNFVNRSQSHFGDSPSVPWNPLGAWETVAASQSAETVNFIGFNVAGRSTVLRQSVAAGTWQAPCDCLAYFQTHVQNRSPSYPACVQFYLVESAQEPSLNTYVPVGVVSVDPSSNSELNTAVPILLKQGQIVKWVGYTAYQITGTEASVVTHTRVDSITYRAFNW